MSVLYCHDCGTQIAENEEIRVPVEEYEGVGKGHPRQMTDDEGYEWKVTHIILCPECGAEYEE